MPMNLNICDKPIFFFQTKCRRQKLCLNCGSTIYGSGSKKSLDAAFDAHSCANKEEENYCKACFEKHKPDIDCFLQVKEFDKLLPKLAFVAGAISDSSSLTCLNCNSVSLNSEKCEIHKYMDPHEPYCNFLYILREVLMFLLIFSVFQ